MNEWSEDRDRRKNTERWCFKMLGGVTCGVSSLKSQHE